MTDIKLNNSTLATASGSTISWGSGVPAGTVVNVIHAVMNTPHELTASGSGVFATIKNGNSGSTNLEAKITLKNSSNKVLVTGYVSCSNINQAEHTAIRLIRTISGQTVSTNSNDTSSNIIGSGANTGSRGRATTAHFTPINTNRSVVLPINTLDAPNTDQEITYTVQYTSNSGNFLLNYTEDAVNTDNSAQHVGQSCITLMEIAQ